MSRRLLVKGGVVKTVVTAPDQGLRDFILIKLAKLEMSRMQESFTV